MSRTATIQFEGKTLEVPVIEGSEGELALDISKLRGETGLITLDQGFVNTGSTTSAITFLNGEKGILRYRGYSIEELAENSTFLEVAYLLIYGELPNQSESDTFTNNVTMHTLLHEDIKHSFQAFPSGAHPMAILSSIVCMLSTYYPDESLSSKADLDLTIFRLIAKLPTIAAWAHKKSIGLPLVYPKNSLDYVSNFLNMMYSVPATEYEIPKSFVDAMNVLLILHADHEQNCSTSTVRLVGSSKANLFVSVSSGIAALWGPLHGGANQAVLEMLHDIQADGGDVKKYIEKTKDKSSGKRLMGFGHRVYKNFDPRATIIKGYCDKVLEEVGINDPLLAIAKTLEEEALKDPYFVEKKLYPNVDFYSGIIYKALGFPIPMFTALFSLGRLPGWIAHWTEMNSAPSRIGRPRQIYTGSNERQFVPISKR